MDDPLRIAAIGVGRIGIFHARHVQELALETGKCSLVAVVDPHEDTAQRVAKQLQADQQDTIRAFKSVEALLESELANGAVIASRTEDHVSDARPLIDAGLRILMEKPLAHSINTASEFCDHLSESPERKDAVMQAFMRRFDAPLIHAKELMDKGLVGRVFKVVSILEDDAPPPVGYNSPGLLRDMSVHNIDETIWLLGNRPVTVSAFGANIHNHKVTTVSEDYDDGFMQLGFTDDVVAQIQVSRNHVAGYRNETHIYGDKGLICVGRFQEDPLQVSVESYTREDGTTKKSFRMKDFETKVPVFLERFGPAYKLQVARYVECCLEDTPFPVTQEDGLNALQVTQAAVQSLERDGSKVSINY
jgi:myo-inositol 2-dehydrogenase/D-chiro-inositol 1-dehydrogenase